MTTSLFRSAIRSCSSSTRGNCSCGSCCSAGIGRISDQLTAIKKHCLTMASPDIVHLYRVPPKIGRTVGKTRPSLVHFAAEYFLAFNVTKMVLLITSSGLINDGIIRSNSASNCLRFSKSICCQFGGAFGNAIKQGGCDENIMNASAKCSVRSISGTPPRTGGQVKDQGTFPAIMGD